jgi:hypothetical protein
MAQVKGEEGYQERPRPSASHGDETVLLVMQDLSPVSAPTKGFLAKAATALAQPNRNLAQHFIAVTPNIEPFGKNSWERNRSGALIRVSLEAQSFDAPL